MLFTPRLKAPSTTNMYYLKKGRIANALNECIEIAKGSCLANCVGYVWGRFFEIIGSRPKLAKGNAENMCNGKDGYKRGQAPKLGAVALA